MAEKSIRKLILSLSVAAALGAASGSALADDDRVEACTPTLRPSPTTRMRRSNITGRGATERLTDTHRTCSELL